MTARHILNCLFVKLLLAVSSFLNVLTSALIMNALKREVNREVLSFPAVADAGRKGEQCVGDY